MKYLTLTFIFASILFSCNCPDCPEQDLITKTDTVFVKNTIIRSVASDIKIPIEGKSFQNFYYQCSNDIIINLPDNLESLQMTANQADVIVSNNTKNKFSIVPKGKSCKINCEATKSGGNIHRWNYQFNVISPPLPKIVLMVNGREYNGVSPISKRSSCVLKIIPEKQFQSAFPNETKYIISKVDLLSQRSLGAPTKVGTSNGSGKDAVSGIQIPLGNKLKSDPPGSKIYFKIDKIYRVNFRNQKIEIPFSDQELYVGAIIK